MWMLETIEVCGAPEDGPVGGPQRTACGARPDIIKYKHLIEQINNLSLEGGRSLCLLAALTLLREP